MKMKMLVCALSAAGALGALSGELAARAGGRAPHTGMFRDGDRVACYGASIVHGGSWERILVDYYVTRFPDAKIDFKNAGVCGDSTGRSLHRFQMDVADWKPTDILIHLMHNDMPRECCGPDPTDEQLARREKKLGYFRNGITNLAARLEKDAGNPRVWWITGTTMNDTGTDSQDDDPMKVSAKTWTPPGVTAAMGDYLQIVRDHAARHGDRLVDVNSAMGAHIRRHQAEDPSYGLWRPDRIHPDARGYFFMARSILRAQGAEALVSDVAVDPRRGAVAKALNATVSDVTKEADGGVSFTVLAKSIPCPVAPEVLPLAEELRFDDEFNQENLAVLYLKPGEWTLEIDGHVVRTARALEWMRGVNLAMNPETPQYQQAQRVLALNEARREQERLYRNMMAARVFFIYHKGNPDNMEDAWLVATGRYDKCGHKLGKGDYYVSKMPEYCANWGRRGEILADIDAKLEAARQMAKPVAHRYRIRPATAEDAAKAVGKAPSYVFKALKQAERYRYRIVDSRGALHVFETMAPTASLTPVWARIAPGPAHLEVIGIAPNNGPGEEGAQVGVAGTADFVK